MNSRSRVFVWLGILCFCISAGFAARVGASPAATAPAARKQKLVPYAQYLDERVVAVLDRLEKDQDYPAASLALQSLFDQAILFAPSQRVDCIREADFARRLVDQLSDVPPEARDPLLPFLRKHEALAQTMAFLLRPGKERIAAAYDLLNRFRQERPDQLDDFSSLVAALCAVQYQPVEEDINENHVKAADPIDIFDYYVRNESRMFFGIRNVPAELLVHVVDTTASIPEMEWALGKYAGTQDVGGLFFTISYDYQYLQRGTQKQLTVNGFNLPNILKYGGVCIDQAYFAATVGKSIGVPTAIDYGTSGEAAHAWVGFFQFNGRDGFWNFDSGRYAEFQGVRGSARDPQTREDIPDCYITLLSQIIGTETLDRQSSVALTDAALRMASWAKVGDAHIPAPPADFVSPSTFNDRSRSIDVASELMLIESALRQSTANIPAWFTVRDLAVANKLNLDDKRRWSDVLLKLGADKYPDFTLSVLMPMVKSVKDAQEQNQLLSNLLPLFQARSDLSASIRMEQAALLESQDQLDAAGQCYEDVIQRYSDDGPFVIGALKAAEKLLKQTNRGDEVVLLYQQAWSRTAKPDGEAQVFIAESNWFRIGKMYANKLTQAGNTDKAAEVRSALGLDADSAAGG